MKKLILSLILFILLATPTALADSVTIGTTINESVFEDTLLNSPFLILGAIIIANIIVFIYRKVRK